MYRRLAVVSRRLEEAGAHHERNRPAMIRRLAGDNLSAANIENLRLFIDLIEPVKEYKRGSHHRSHRQLTPLAELADCARPESDAARLFSNKVDELIARWSKLEERSVNTWMVDLLSGELLTWRTAAEESAGLLASRTALGRDGAPVAKALAEASEVGIAALAALKEAQIKDAAWRAAQLAVLDQAAVPHNAIELPIIPALRRLVQVVSTEKP
jgi:hypothetical protein